MNATKNKIRYFEYSGFLLCSDGSLGRYVTGVACDSEAFKADIRAAYGDDIGVVCLTQRGEVR